MKTTTEEYRVEQDTTEYYQWTVVDSGSNVVDQFETKREAEKEARSLNRDAEIQRLADAIVDRGEELRNDGDLETLRKMAALMGL